MLECLYKPEVLQIYQKDTPAQVFFCEICKIFKSSTYFEEHLLTVASIESNYESKSHV